MKILFLIGLLALVGSTAFAQYYGGVTGSYGDVAGGGGPQQCPVVEKTKPSSCRNYLLERCTMMKDFPFTLHWWKWWKGGCEEVLSECCNHLRQTPPQCRCNIIWGSIQDKLGGGILGFQRGQTSKAMQMAKNLPSRCNLGPGCDIPTTGGYYW